MTIKLLERNTSTDDELVIIREFAVPKSLVFNALTDHDNIKKWSSPKNYDVTFSEGKLKVGGKYSYGMQSDEGPEFVMTGEYKEIDRPDKIVYTQSGLDASGSETEISITLEEHEGKTTMVFHHTGFPSKEFRDGAVHGWNEAFEKLETHLTSLSKVVLRVTREENIETVRKLVRLFEQKRIDEFAELFSENAKLIQPFSSGLFPAVIEGHNEIHDNIQDFVSNFDDIQLPIVEILPLEDPRRIVMKHTGKLRKLNCKDIYENDYIGIYSFDENGKITKWIEYNNPITAAKAFGLMDKILQLKDGSILRGYLSFEKIENHLTSQVNDLLIMTRERNIETVRNFVNLLEQRRFDEFADLFSENAKWIHPFNSGMFPYEAIGRNDIRNAIEDAASNFDDIRFPIEEILSSVDPRRIVLKHTGRLKVSNGQGIYENDYLAIYSFDEEGKITEWIEYYNPINAAIAFGLMEKIKE